MVLQQITTRNCEMCWEAYYWDTNTCILGGGVVYIKGLVAVGAMVLLMLGLFN
jgi:hypothetical protein